MKKEINKAKEKRKMEIKKGEKRKRGDEKIK